MLLRQPGWSDAANVNNRWHFFSELGYHTLSLALYSTVLVTVKRNSHFSMVYLGLGMTKYIIKFAVLPMIHKAPILFDNH